MIVTGQTEALLFAGSKRLHLSQVLLREDRVVARQHSHSDLVKGELQVAQQDGCIEREGGGGEEWLTLS